MKNKIVLTLSILLISMISFAQSTKLSGKIIDDKTGAPIEYATLRVLKTNIATLTNGAGEFTLNAEVDDEVEVTHVSYKTIKIFLKNQNIQLILF